MNVKVYNTAVKITPIKTHKITNKDKSIFQVLDRYIKKLPEKSIVAVSSKIISITEGRIVEIKKGDLDQKDELIKEESQFYLPRTINKYGVSFTITNNILAAAAGIDESNGGGYYILWPKNPQKSANMIRSYLSSRFNLSNIGVIITDSKATPLRWGVTGLAIAHSGFQALNSYVGKEDLFGRKFEFEKVNVMDSLATAATYVMGEGAESTPLAIIEDIPDIIFQKRSPTKKELSQLRIALEDDLFAPLLQSVKWKRGKQVKKAKKLQIAS